MSLRDLLHIERIQLFPERGACSRWLRTSLSDWDCQTSADLLPQTWANELAMYKLYSMQRSGNSYKVRLALALLNAPYKAIEVDILRGESRTPEFLAKNPSGQV